MTSIEVCVLEFQEGGKAIWIHNSQGATVVRIQCTGHVKIHKGCTNICAHTDINVVGDIDVCIPDAKDRPVIAPKARKLAKGINMRVKSKSVKA